MTVQPDFHVWFQLITSLNGLDDFENRRTGTLEGWAPRGQGLDSLISELLERGQRTRPPEPLVLEGANREPQERAEEEGCYSSIETASHIRNRPKTGSNVPPPTRAPPSGSSSANQDGRAETGKTGWWSLSV